MAEPDPSVFPDPSVLPDCVDIDAIRSENNFLEATSSGRSHNDLLFGEKQFMFDSRGTHTFGALRCNGSDSCLAPRGLCCGRRFEQVSITGIGIWSTDGERFELGSAPSTDLLFSIEVSEHLIMDFCR